MDEKSAVNMTDGEDGESLIREVVVANQHGLHARPAGKLAQLAQTFAADVVIALDEQEVDAKSILDVLTLAAGQGAILQLRASGSDAAEALDRLEALISGRFEEE